MQIFGLAARTDIRQMENGVWLFRVIAHFRHTNKNKRRAPRLVAGRSGETHLIPEKPETKYQTSPETVLSPRKPH